jgi:hypothetical protein
MEWFPMLFGHIEVRVDSRRPRGARRPIRGGGR